MGVAFKFYHELFTTNAIYTEQVNGFQTVTRNTVSMRKSKTGHSTTGI